MSKTADITSVKVKFDKNQRPDMGIIEFAREWKQKMEDEDSPERMIEVTSDDEKMAEVLGIMGSIVNDSKLPNREQWSRVVAILRNFHLAIVVK